MNITTTRSKYFPEINLKLEILILENQYHDKKNTRQKECQIKKIHINFKKNN
jgi:hypothetical protein